MADQEEDVKILLNPPLETFIKNTPFYALNLLRTSQVYRNVTGDICLICHQIVKVDVSSRVRRVASLSHCSIMWKICKEELQTSIIDQRDLQSLESDRRVLLMGCKW